MTEIRLPFPPSTNNLFINAGRKRVLSPEYRAWKTQAAWELKAQKVKKFEGRALIHIDLDDTRRGDADNRAKAVLDALVDAEVLAGDSKKHVRRVSIGWERITGCRVAILGDEE